MIQFTAGIVKQISLCFFRHRQRGQLSDIRDQSGIRPGFLIKPGSICADPFAIRIKLRLVITA